MSCCGNCPSCNPDYYRQIFSEIEPPLDDFKRDGHLWFKSDGTDISLTIVPSQAEMMTDHQLERYTKTDAVDESGAFVFSPEQSEQAIKYFQEAVDAETGLPIEEPVMNETFPGMSWSPALMPLRLINPQWSLAKEYAVKAQGKREWRNRP